MLVLDGSPSPSMLLSSMNKLNILDKFLPLKHESKQMVDIHQSYFSRTDALNQDAKLHTIANRWRRNI
jgi:hypothetical protein